MQTVLHSAGSVNENCNTSVLTSQHNVLLNCFSCFKHEYIWDTLALDVAYDVWRDSQHFFSSCWQNNVGVDGFILQDKIVDVLFSVTRLVVHAVEVWALPCPVPLKCGVLQNYSVLTVKLSWIPFDSNRAPIMGDYCWLVECFEKIFCLFVICNYFRSVTFVFLNVGVLTFCFDLMCSLTLFKCWESLE